MESLGIAFKGDDWNWRVGNEIGQGRYGVVYIAINEQGAHAAIKCLHSKYAENHVAIRRLLKELTVLRSLQHIAIPKILDQGLTAEGLPFLALEFLKGETLGVMRKRLGGQVPLDTVLAIAAQSLDALEYAHQSGIIHRDLSPNNLFRTTDGCLKLLDLGLCSALELSGTLAYITGRTVLGTPGFISPEAARGESGLLDPRADIWSLGAVLFALLTGESVYMGSIDEQMTAVKSCPAPSLASATMCVPSGVIDWIDRALAFAANARWPSAAAMRNAMRDFSTEVASSSETLPPAGTNCESSSTCPTTVDRSEPVESARGQKLSLHLVHCPRSSNIPIMPLSRDSPLSIGRSSALADWCVSDDQVSRHHARISWDHEYGAYRITDIGSRNGVEVNRSRCNTQCLQPGDVIRIGHSLFVVVDEGHREGFDGNVKAACAGTATVLLTGETGVGKDRLARAIHEKSGRKGAFISVNCASLTRELATSELFGHDRGAFTGAERPYIGLFRAADKGTLLLDEIGDLPRSIQPVLLRTLQESAVRPVGSSREQPIDVRVIAATNVPLDAAIANGQFRLDLFARLSAIDIQVDPLRERRHEILGIFRDLMSSASVHFEIDSNAAEAILLGPWPTNVRGLQRILLKLAGDKRTMNNGLDIAALSSCEPELVRLWKSYVKNEKCQSIAVPSGGDILRHRDSLQICLEENGGSVTRVAQHLNTTRAQVYRWLRRLGIETDRQQAAR